METWSIEIEHKKHMLQLKVKHKNVLDVEPGKSEFRSKTQSVNQ